MHRCIHTRLHLILTLALALGAVTLAGCGPTWMVVRDGGSPSPLRGAGPISVSFDYSRFSVEGRSEQEFVQGKLVKYPDYPTTWAELKQQLEVNFINGFAEWPGGVGAGPPGPGVHAIVFPTALTIGHYMVVAATPTTIDANILFTVNGQPADEIAVTQSEPASAFRPTVFAHVPPIGVYLGQVTSRFVQSKNK